MCRTYRLEYLIHKNQSFLIANRRGSRCWWRSVQERSIMITSPLLSPPFILLGLERKNLCLVSLVLVVVGFVVVDSVLALANRRITSGPSGSFEKKRWRILRALNDLPHQITPEAVPSSSYQTTALEPFSKCARIINTHNRKITLTTKEIIYQTRLRKT